MAHKKAGGSTTNGRESQSKRLGIKKHDGEAVTAGMVIVRQRGTPIHAGTNVFRGGDDTLVAAKAGKVKFATRKRRRFDGNLKTTKFAHVL
jgi:large subunit ribosomal protein L27